MLEKGQSRQGSVNERHWAAAHEPKIFPSPQRHDATLLRCRLRLRCLPIGDAFAHLLGAGVERL